MTKFTVLLLYPDYVPDNYGKETYLGYVDAMSVDEAQRTVQHEAYEAYFGSDQDEWFGEPADFIVLAVMRGTHNDLKETE